MSVIQNNYAVREDEKKKHAKGRYQWQSITSRLQQAAGISCPADSGGIRTPTDLKVSRPV